MKAIGLTAFGGPEVLVVPAESVVRVPAGATGIEAATLPMNGLTARMALDLLELPAGATVAVTGAAGAVGGYAVQLAKADGFRVIADAGPKDEQLVYDVGADVVLPRGVPGDGTKEGGRRRRRTRRHRGRRRARRPRGT
ncbi:hypothetical protein GCM10010103_09920 [Streptomyces paradoxus]|uniref:NADPH:quinone reductase-like Zn-dependent oxidoreductase n=1 Tax=Streptomyces paradoxus TaxID=66375 RepID=A0A7W9WEH9_9ACTN|nr:hypothetical protein [Streptomyces paradoxus]MBB6074133.1 NADPH:quinone reductase-like Zn-dependent oxidoreductase [Streptomyces paradoxus]